MSSELYPWDLISKLAEWDVFANEEAQITKVTLIDTSKLEPALELLATIPTLRRLELTSGARLRLADCRRVARHLKITDLTLSAESVSPRGLEELLSTWTLESLDIELGASPRSYLRIVGQHHSLKKLKISERVSLFDDDFDVVEGLKNLESLNIWSHCVQGYALQSFCSSKKLRELSLTAKLHDRTASYILAWRDSLRILDIGNTYVTNAFLSEIDRFSELRELYVNGCYIDDSVMPVILRLPHLERLWVSHTFISRASVRHLLQAQNLKELNVARTLLRPSDVKELRRALKQCAIHY